MAISFVKFQNTVRITITAPFIPDDPSGETGAQIEVLDPPLAGRLFAESHMPKVGDIIIFDAPASPNLYVTSIRVQGRDMPKTTTIPGNSPNPVTYVFAVANGPSSWTVSAVGQDDSVTIVRGET
jgi:hypothetical protein